MFTDNVIDHALALDVNKTDGSILWDINRSGLTECKMGCCTAPTIKGYEN